MQKRLVTAFYGVDVWILCGKCYCVAYIPVLSNERIFAHFSCLVQILAYTQTLAAVSESAVSSNGCVECGTTEKSGAFSYCAGGNA